MSGWYLEREGAEATRVVLPVTRGDVAVPEEQADAVSVSLDGSVTVWSSPAQAPSPAIPTLHFAPRDRYQLTRLRALVQSRVVCTLGTDYGATYRVKCTGAWRPVFVATTQRLTKPRWEVTLTVVGV